nr:hypothetical protein [uncultured Flavobacterium sp.]
MKDKFLIGLVMLVLFSCQKKEITEKNIIKAIVQDTLSKTIGGTADVSATPPKEDKAVELIRTKLQILLKKDLPAITTENRYFYYEAFDLNNDQKDEYFVGLSNSYFCGSRGCSGYILNNDGSLINKFTVTNFPIYVTTTPTEKFYDLIIETGGKFHHIKFNKGKYPSNPSVQPEHKGDLAKGSSKVLDIQRKKLQRYSF